MKELDLAIENAKTRYLEISKIANKRWPEQQVSWSMGGTSIGAGGIARAMFANPPRDAVERMFYDTVIRDLSELQSSIEKMEQYRADFVRAFDSSERQISALSEIIDALPVKEFA